MTTSTITTEAEESLRIRAQAQYDRIKAGPYLEPNGIGGLWVVVPSDWKNSKATAFWRKVGCRFVRVPKSWVKTVPAEYQGQTYTAGQWLASLRKKFFEFHAEELARADAVFASGDVYIKR